MNNVYLAPVIQIPSSLLITAITRANPMVVSVAIGNDTTEANTYIVGMAVRLFVPYDYGMFQANNLVGTITDISGSDFTLDINSNGFDTFAVPSGTGITPASISPAGSRNLEYSNRTDSVPFQSLNNVGN